MDEGKEVTISHSWLTRQCPGLLTGLTMWFSAILLPFSATSHCNVYHLPAVHTDEDKEQKYNLELDLLIWVLSCVLPNIYMGGAGRRTQHSEVCMGYRI